MRFASRLLGLCLLATVVVLPGVSAHWVKLDQCGTPGIAWVSKNPSDYEPGNLLSSDPSAVVVLYACVPCGDDGGSNIEVAGVKILSCGTHG